MSRFIHNIMMAQYKQNDAVGFGSVCFENGISCILPDVNTDATGGQMLCRGRNLITPSYITVVPVAESGVGAWTSKQLGKALLPPGKYTIFAKYRQLSDITTVSVSIRDYDTISTSFGESPGSASEGHLHITFTIPEESRGCTVYLYSNLTANYLATKCEFYDIMLVCGTYTANTIPGFEEYYDGGCASLPLSQESIFIQPNGFCQFMITDSMVSENKINVKYITHS